MFWGMSLTNFKRPKRRQIFSYWNGKKYSKIDPLLVEERLEQHEKYRPDVHPQAAAHGELEAFNVCVDAYSKAFDVSIFDGASGLTRGEIFALMSAFDRYMLSLKKSTKATQTPVQSTDAILEKSNAETMSDTSDSSSTCPGKKCDDPTKCTQESCRQSGCTSEDAQ